MNSQPAATDCQVSPTWRLVMAISVLIAVAACSSDGPAGESVQAQTQASAAESETRALPGGFPEQMPLPDEYMIVRDSSRVTEKTGQEIAMNIALPGRIEKWMETYQAALEREFRDVEFREAHNSLQWRFHGHGFEYAVLYLNDNQGYLDRGSIDSSHLPVMLTLNMMERHPGQ